MLLVLSTLVLGARVSDISSTSHNLSAGSGGVESTETTEICVFCHTPHGANTASGGPLWNRSLGAETYTAYDSLSMDATPGPPGDSSKLCLSCHDGTMAIGAVGNKPGRGPGDGSPIAMAGTDGGKMPAGDGIDSGYTRNLGTDLTNDHPIGITFDENLIALDSEFKLPDYSPLKTPDKIECATCHDPHIAGSDTFSANMDGGVTEAATGPDSGIKFLRLNRFQTEELTSTFNPDTDINCLDCHDKADWEFSAHAEPLVADERYTRAAANARDFPDGDPSGQPIAVWEAACLNCHDTHTDSVSPRLLRGATDGTANEAIENTCFQCHGSTNNAIGTATGGVPDIETEFNLGIRKPIYTSDQATTPPPHDIQDSDFTESRDKLGHGGNLQNRHVECTDCHNPHAMYRSVLFYLGAGVDDTTAQHDHGRNLQHSNIASGALRGSRGVEPTYGALTTWPQLPTGYDLKKGDPGTSTDTARSNSYMTREYQLCFKCHSSYAYNDTNEYGSGDASKTGTAVDFGGAGSGRPSLDNTRGGTPSGTNDMTYFTNQAAEWAVDANDALSGSDQGEVGGGGVAEPSQVNHRSWHPVTYPTGRTMEERRMFSSNGWEPAFENGVGELTMYCSDCHGSRAADDGISDPVSGVYGPHGSQYDFLLRGEWGRQTDNVGDSDLCFKCHDRTTYAANNASAATADTGFGWAENSDYPSNLHQYHSAEVASGGFRCTICHVAVPHGWKNKAFLANLYDVGREGGFSTSTSIPFWDEGDPGRRNADVGYDNPPYYLDAKLRVDNWKSSGEWTVKDCMGGNEDGMDNQCGPS